MLNFFVLKYFDCNFRNFLSLWVHCSILGTFESRSLGYIEYILKVGQLGTFEKIETM